METFYHGTTSKILFGFREFFKGIQIRRVSKDGKKSQVIDVPINFGPKQKWFAKTESDKDHKNYTYGNFPLMTYEILGYVYDPNRKTNRSEQFFKNQESRDSKSAYSPVPYNMNIDLHIVTTNTQDYLQIIEYILPFFTPEYTLSFKNLYDGFEEMETNVPVILNNIQHEDNWQGPYTERRFVITTLNFTLKYELFGKVQLPSNIIFTSTVNMDSDDFDDSITVNHVVNKTDTTNISESWNDFSNSMENTILATDITEIDDGGE